MGGSEGKQIKPLLGDYSFLRKESTQFYGEIAIMQEVNTKQYVAVKEQIFQSSKDYQTEFKRLTNQARKTHPNVIPILKVVSTSEENLCSTVYKLAWTIEYLAHDLSKVITERRKQAEPQYFSEKELFALITQTVAALAYLQQGDLYHGDLRASKIFVSPDNTYKIADPSTVRTLPAYAVLLSGSDRTGIYLSPQLMDSYKAQNWTPQHNIHKSDAFSLGMIMLETGLLENFDSLYNYDNCTFQKEVFQSKLAAFKQRFKGICAELVEHMLELTEEKRLDFLQLFEKIRTHQISAREERALKVINDTQLIDNRTVNPPGGRPNKCNENTKPANIQPQIKKDLDFNSKPDQQKPLNLSSEIKNQGLHEDDHDEELLQKETKQTPNEEEHCRKVIVEVEEDLEKEEFRPRGPSSLDKSSQEGSYRSDEMVSSRCQLDDVNFISPEIQAILNDCKGIKAGEKASDSLAQGTFTFAVPNFSSSSFLNATPLDATSKFEPKIKLEKDYVTETYADGSIYEGEMLHGLRHGRGKFHYKIGGLYDGEWKFGRMEGQGTLYYPSGQLAFNGEWQEDKFNGKGVMYNEAPEQVAGAFDFSNFDKLANGWSHYEGSFRDDRKEGFGMLYLTNGEKVEGNFLNDFINGTGLFFSLYGKVYQGTWVYNRLVSTPVLKSIPEMLPQLKSQSSDFSATNSIIIGNSNSIESGRPSSQEEVVENGFNFNFDYDAEEIKEERKLEQIRELSIDMKMDNSKEVSSAEKKPLEDQLLKNVVGNHEIEEMILKQYSGQKQQPSEGELTPNEKGNAHEGLSSSYVGSDSFESQNA